MNLLVIDASVAVKWFVPEAGSEVANGLLRAHRELLAPDFLWVEVGQVIWKMARRGSLAPGAAGRIMASRRAFPVECHACLSLLDDAIDLAVETDRTVYDCLYLALAIREGAILLTADERFVNALESTAAKGHVRLLGEDF